MKIVISDSRPIIERSISIDDELFVKAFDYLHNPILLSRISINDTRQIESLLDEVDKYSPIFEPDYSSSQISINNHIDIAIRKLENAITLLECESCEFHMDDRSFCGSASLKTYLHFFVGSKNNRRYNIITQVFSLKIFGMSPACYRIIQGSNCLILPHERKLLAIKNTLGISGD